MKKNVLSKTLETQFLKNYQEDGTLRKVTQMLNPENVSDGDKNYTTTLRTPTWSFLIIPEIFNSLDLVLFFVDVTFSKIPCSKSHFEKIFWS